MGLVLVALVVVLISALWKKIWMELIWRPYAITKSFRKQGVRGPPYKFLKGSFDEFRSIEDGAREIVLDKSSHDITVRVLAHFREWTKLYGRTFLFWVGADQPKLCLTDPEMIREVLVDKSGTYDKFQFRGSFFPLLGRGLFLIEGEQWARHRRIIDAAFALDKTRMKTMEIAECAKVILDRWYCQATQANNLLHNEIEVHQELDELFADVIARTAFGSSFKEEKEIFLVHKKLRSVILETAFTSRFPGFEYLPTKANRYKWDLERTMRERITCLINSRLNSDVGKQGNDLLGLLIESSRKEGSQMLSMDEIIDECKTFFAAGYESTSVLLAWAMFLLSTNQEWQEKLREEVLQECTNEVPSADALSRLKLVTMVLLETLRLYNPAFVFERQTKKDATLGNLKIPKGTGLAIPVALVHRLEEIWGADANEFNPTRFENGVSRASSHLHPNAFLSFSAGHRKCAGQGFAMLEAKIVMAMILQRFRFSLSSNYKHAPEMSIILRPKYGLPICFQPLHV